MRLSVDNDIIASQDIPANYPSSTPAPSSQTPSSTIPAPDYTSPDPVSTSPDSPSMNPAIVAVPNKKSKPAPTMRSDIFVQAPTTPSSTEIISSNEISQQQQQLYPAEISSSGISPAVENVSNLNSNADKLVDEERLPAATSGAANTMPSSVEQHATNEASKPLNTSLADLKKQRAKERQDRLYRRRGSVGSEDRVTGGDVAQNGAAPARTYDEQMGDNGRRRKHSSNRYDLVMPEKSNDICCIIM